MVTTRSEIVNYLQIVQIIDTNGCAGLSETHAHLGLSGTIDAIILTLTGSGEGGFTLSRLN